MVDAPLRHCPCGGGPQRYRGPLAPLAERRPPVGGSRACPGRSVESDPTCKDGLGPWGIRRWPRPFGAPLGRHGSLLGRGAERAPPNSLGRVQGLLVTPSHPRWGRGGCSAHGFHWSDKPDASGRWTGRLRLQVLDLIHARRLHAHLHGRPLLTGPDWLHLSISHNLLPLAVLILAPPPGGEGQAAPQQAQDLCPAAPWSIPPGGEPDEAC